MSDPTPDPVRSSKPAGGNLDAILVVGALALVGGGLAGLFLMTVPQANLPIIASLLSFLSGSVLGAYAGFRWGASDAMKKASGESGGQ